MFRSGTLRETDNPEGANDRRFAGGATDREPKYDCLRMVALRQGNFLAWRTRSRTGAFLLLPIDPATKGIIQHSLELAPGLLRSFARLRAHYPRLTVNRRT